MKLPCTTKSFCFVLSLLIATCMLALAAPASAQCPAINALGNFVEKPEISASFTCVDTNSDTIPDTCTYDVTTPNENPVDGVPGLIEYCVYPGQPPGNPDSATATYDSWKTSFKAIQGYFAFGRPDGNPTNIPFDGTTQTVGEATWDNGSPSLQDILLHINSPDECAALYPGSNTDTCFVKPSGGGGGGGGCPNGEVACKQVVIDEACPNCPDTVPTKTLLHLHYTYTINNDTACTMLFKPVTAKTQDINSGGGKDYFGCEQIPDPAGSPASSGTYCQFLNLSQGDLDLNLTVSPSNQCQQSRFFLTNGKVSSPTCPSSVPTTIAPGDVFSFNIDMITRKNKGGKQEYTSEGCHFLNSGFTVKWFACDSVTDTGRCVTSDTCDGLLHSFTTNPPISVNAVSSCPAEGDQCFGCSTGIPTATN